MVSLKGKIVFVTGASSGIGESTAQAFAAQGARILMCARRVERLEKLAQTLEFEYGVAAHYFRLDVRDQPAVDKAVAGLPPEWRAIEILVNNAGLSRGLDKLPQGLLDDWAEMIDTNVKGLLYRQPSDYSRDDRTGQGPRHQYRLDRRPRGLSRRERLLRDEIRRSGSVPRTAA